MEVTGVSGMTGARSIYYNSGVNYARSFSGIYESQCRVLMG